jgi:hypothetical protein
MPLYKNKSFITTGIALCILFAFLMALRIGFFKKEIPEYDFISPEKGLAERDTWMKIMQQDRKIGFSRSLLSKTPDGYSLQESVFMRINTMGMIQDVTLKTEGILNQDLTLKSFVFEISSGRFDFRATGEIKGEILSIHTSEAGTPRRMDIPVKNKPYLAAVIAGAAFSGGANPGDVFTLDIFDPASMGQIPVLVKIGDKEEIVAGGEKTPAVKILVTFKGTTQYLWIGNNGEILKEKGVLGMSLEKTTKEDALNGLSFQASEDLTKTASVLSNVSIDDPGKISFFKAEIEGIETARLMMTGERQVFENGIITIERESLLGLPVNPYTKQSEKEWLYFLKPDQFIQSDNKKIKEIALKVTDPADPPLTKARKIVKWINDNIEKRPVISLPDALSTIQNRAGDCNEHAVLMAALSRAAGVPAKIEAGLVYLNGRFYYHAWNLLYLGRWISVDPLFGQIPADATHIRFSSGEPKEQLALVGIIGKVKLKVIEYR